MRSKEDDKNKKNKKKDKKDKTTKETEKNKENISSENMVAWKKISKSTKERQYREKDKRSRSKERSRKKERETPKKKEKRKELPRYDVRKLVAEKPRKDAYGRDLRNDSRSLSRSLSRLRRSRSYSRGRSRSRSRASWGRGCRSLSRKRSRSRSKRREKKRSISRYFFFPPTCSTCSLQPYSNLCFSGNVKNHCQEKGQFLVGSPGRRGVGLVEDQSRGNEDQDPGPENEGKRSSQRSTGRGRVPRTANGRAPGRRRGSRPGHAIRNT